MIYKILGSAGGGRGYCGHLIKRGEIYFIESIGRELHAKCQKCIGILKIFRTIRIPKDLVDGAIPLK